MKRNITKRMRRRWLIARTMRRPGIMEKIKETVRLNELLLARMRGRK